MKNWKLTKKFLTGILLTLAVVFSIIVVLLGVYEKKVLVSELTNKGNNLAKFLSGIAAEPILSYNFTYLENYVRDISAGDATIVYAVILDKQGNPLTHKKPEPKDKKGLLEFSSPIMQDSEQIGLVKIGINTAHINTEIRRSQFVIIGLSIGALVLITILVYLLFRITTFQPIGKLKAVMEKVASGDLTQTAEITEHDEIGQLTSSFNKVVTSMKDILRNVVNSSFEVSAFADKVAKNSNQIFHSAQEEASAVEKTTSSMEEMAKSIESVAKNAEALATNADESSASVLEMTAAINEVAQSANNLNTIVEDTSSFITEMSASIKQIDENVDILSSSAEETASAVSEIATTIKGVEENVNESARLSEEVKKEASELGMEAVEKTMEGMKKIKGSVEASGGIIDRLGERSKQIGKVLTVIDDVTDQTNLLALNAAIIAAQAGEHGKGFAVVADEIKDLAERTVASTKEISQMIESIQKEVGEAVISMKESSDNVVEGIELSKEAANALKKILERSDRSAQMSKEIEKATKEQGKGVFQVSEEVQKIMNMVREIAHATQEQRKGSEQIMGSVEKMKDISRQVRQATIEQTKGSKQINDAVENVNQKVHAIVKATKEQSIGSEQIVTSVEKIRNITQENIKSSSEIKDRIEYLSKQAELLKGEVKRFII